MSFDNRTYVILTASEAQSIDFDTVLEPNANALRWNNDESKTIVKYEGPKPRWLYGKTGRTWAQIRAEVQKDEWAGEESIPPE